MSDDIFSRVSNSDGSSDLSIDSIALNTAFKKWIHIVSFSDDVHRASEKCLQVFFDVNKIEQAWLYKVNNNVYVAVNGLFSTGYRTKDTNTANAIFVSDGCFVAL